MATTTEKKLANWLEDEYKLDKSGTILLKKDLTIKIKNADNKEINIVIKNNDLFILPFGSKNNKSLIVRCTKTLTHPFCLHLKDKTGIKFDVSKYKIWVEPCKENNLHGYIWVYDTNGNMADGEVDKNTLQTSMLDYAWTIMLKRAEDRLILRILELYQKGFYGEDEVTPQMKKDSSSVVDHNQFPEKNGEKREGLNKKIKELRTKLDLDNNAMQKLANELAAVKKGSKVKMDDISIPLLKKIKEHLENEIEKIK